MTNTLSIEKKEKAAEVLKEVSKIEKEFNSPYKRSIEDTEKCYTDAYILEVWKSEGLYNEETGQGWHSFEDFLVDFIKENIEFENNSKIATNK